ncbi:hypothetical protein TRVL_09533 [Trypanosoma vivax]|nr:hypothetical protein TRVL_09533 [Trypanosoma vivax]
MRCVRTWAQADKTQRSCTSDCATTAVWFCARRWSLHAESDIRAQVISYAVAGVTSFETCCVLFSQFLRAVIPIAMPATHTKNVPAQGLLLVTNNTRPPSIAVRMCVK